MAFAYSSTIQARIAQAVFGVAYASLDTTQKSAIDGGWASGSLTTGFAYDALTQIQSVANWFEMAGATSAPQLWEGWLVAETVAKLAPTYRPDRQGAYIQTREECIDLLLDSFALRDPTGTFAAANTSQARTVNGLRLHTLLVCARRANGSTGLRRRLFPPIDQIDANIQWALNFLYNKDAWNFRKREVSLLVTQLAFPTAATWTENTLTLTQVGAFTNVPATAQLTTKTVKVRVASGTGAVVDEYRVVTKTSNDAVILAQSISSTGADLSTGDIAGTISIVEVRGTVSGETFDSVASRKFYSVNNSIGGGYELVWVDATNMDMAKAYPWWYGSSPSAGMPCYCRTETLPNDVFAWTLWPFPDASYQFKGSVYIAGPGTPSSATDTAVFQKFPAKFFPHIKELVLAKTLQDFATSDSELRYSRVMENIERDLAEYVDMGTASHQTCMNDVYQDSQRTLGNSCGSWVFGGGQGML